ncbi:unnamed protein product [Fraxinus pennsylvanica]|uniref:Uncharacterized protein n=1 Tax=Fraxinus pennsylvanica TaxID=56036 RepID=A0AAD1YSY3_9LAMI|nr:unnamed protein product [Fraxinus pennsylvanica]
MVHKIQRFEESINPLYLNPISAINKLIQNKLKSTGRADCILELGEGQYEFGLSCMPWKTSFPHPRANPRITPSKVMPQPSVPSNVVAGAPRLVRSCAVRRDLVRDWNFDEVMLER